ncbi:site-specific DNA-methyltransferase [Micrococcus yunnanensis]|uniref:site-specific DNA-methyltransferase n=1 Tax=Micrococcus yunnanensis TaxID=566027 RepID=UPI001F2E218C|nr:site-specific DNA-methyltransferase [Micrococcus yunnanensis]MCF8560247.1 site-specific DNA-methyltransferase [Micrococcus yunnanensis]
MPELTWVGKDKVITHHLDVPLRVLDRKYSFDEVGQSETDNDSPNMIIHGDNLEALKALLPRYEGRVDCIYIDPPYNTGNESWVYNDNVSDPRLQKWLGDVVGKEGEDLTRHDKWLCMMYPRLRLLHRLLAPTGAIFISIDDNEVAALRLICDEIFGARCFIADISWQRTYATRNDSKGIPAEVEHLLAFSKEPDWKPNTLSRTASMDSKYKNPDNDVSAWRTDNATAPGAATHQGMVYAIQSPFTGELVYPAQGRCWTFEQPEVMRIMAGWTDYELKDLNDAVERARVCGISPDKVKPGVPALVLAKPLAEARQDAQTVYEKGPWPRFFFTRNGQGGIARKTYLDAVGGLLPTNLWTHQEAGHTDEAKKEIRAIFNGRVAFDTPKPSRLVERVLAIASKPGDLILDSFAGSGTTGQAVLNVNARDGGGRRFILVELGDYAETVTAERVRRTIRGYKGTRSQEHVLFDQKLTVATVKRGADVFAEAMKVYEEALGTYTKVSRPKVTTTVTGKTGVPSVRVVAIQEHEQDVSGTGGSFSYYELGEPLLREGDLNPILPLERLRQYIWFTSTGQPYQGGAEKVHPDFLGTHAGVSYFFAYDASETTVLDRSYLASIPTTCRAEAYVVFADVCVLPEGQLATHGVTFKKIPRDIARL